MSVIWSNDRGWIVCHSLFLRKIYNRIENDQPCSTCGRYRVFHIDQPFLKQGQKRVGRFVFDDNNDRGRITNTDEDDHRHIVGMLGDYSADDFKLYEALVLPNLFRNLMRDFVAAKVGYFVEGICPGALANNISAIDCANATLSRIAKPAAVASSSSSLSNDENYDGGNVDERAVVVTVKNETYFIPSRCRFYNYDIDRMVEKINRDSPPYDFILIDPPWPNKHVKRKNASSNAAVTGYGLMKADRLAEIPIDDYLSNSGLLAVWCTNSAQQIDALINRLFPRWNVEYVATWYWIKVTQNAQPICDFAEASVAAQNKKQPFERIIFASRSNRCAVYNNPPPNKILVSIPSVIHSHKPPLVEVLNPYLPANDCRCMELFARYLLPNWTSYGNEVLKLQSSSLFR